MLDAERPADAVRREALAQRGTVAAIGETSSGSGIKRALPRANGVAPAARRAILVRPR